MACAARRAGIPPAVELPGAYGNPGNLDAEVAAVAAMYDAFARRDVEAALVHVHEDVEFTPSGTATLTGRPGPYRGKDGIREYFADASRVWQELTIKAEDVRAAAGGVIVFGHIEGIAADGERVRRRVLWTWQLRDGLAISMRASDLG